MGPHGTPWGPMEPMGTHGNSWGPMGNPWGPMGTPWDPWEPMETHGVIRHRFFFFVPETLNPIFLGKSKKTRAGKCSRSVKLKVDLVNYDAIWCQIGSQFPWVRFFYFLLSMENQGNISFFSVFIFHGFSMDFPWISH